MRRLQIPTGPIERSALRAPVADRDLKAGESRVPSRSEGGAR